MAIVKMTRKQKAEYVDELLRKHVVCLDRKLESKDREVLDVLVRFLHLPSHIHLALGQGFAKTDAYRNARLYVLSARDALTMTAVYDYSTERRRMARFEGACAGYLFAMKERGEL